MKMRIPEFDKSPNATAIPHAIDARRFWDVGVGVFRGLLNDGYFTGIETALAQRLSLLEKKAPIKGKYKENLKELSDRLIQLENYDMSLQSALYEAMGTSPEIYEAAINSNILAVVRSLLSDQLMIHKRLALLMLSPKQQWHLGHWHQDWYYNKGPTTALTAYIPLQKTTKENGMLEFALPQKGRQWDLLQHGDNNQGTKWHTIAPAIVDNFTNVASVELERGDVVLFHSLTPHNANVNHSNRVRFVGNFRYFDLSDTTFRNDNWEIGNTTYARNAMARKNGK